VRVDFLEIFDDGIAESIFTEDTIATAARPGTSLKLPATGRQGTSRDGPSPAIRSLCIFLWNLISHEFMKP